MFALRPSVVRGLCGLTAQTACIDSLASTGRCDNSYTEMGAPTPVVGIPQLQQIAIFRQARLLLRIKDWVRCRLVGTMQMPRTAASSSAPFQRGKIQTKHGHVTCMNQQTLKQAKGARWCAPRSRAPDHPSAHRTRESALKSTTLAWHSIASARSAKSRGHRPNSDALDLNAKDTKHEEREKHSTVIQVVLGPIAADGLLHSQRRCWVH